MKARIGRFLLLALSFSANAGSIPEPKFREITIDDKIQIGYGLAIADVDGDGLPDILLADKRQFVWYRNPGREQCDKPGAWQKFVLAENLTEKDNVCIAAQDIDGDGKCEIAVGAGWNPGDTENSGAVFYLIPPADRTQRWQPVKLHAEPTTHRMRWVRVDNTIPSANLLPDEPDAQEKPRDGTAPGKESQGPGWGLVVVPLHGRGNKDGAGAGVRVLLYRPPAQFNDPAAVWKMELIEDKMHMMHGFTTFPDDGSPGDGLLLSGKEGVGRYKRQASGWLHVDADALAAVGQNGVGEVREFGAMRKIPSGGPLATVEPMHGNRLTIYEQDRRSDAPLYGNGVVLTDKLVEGHALVFADLLSAGSPQIVVGWRGKAGDPASTTGLSLWAPAEPGGQKWQEFPIDSTGMACEDLQLADLNGDGKLDIVAAGRATRNVKIYFNESSR